MFSGFAALEADSDPARHREVARKLEATFRSELGDGAVEVPLPAWLGYGVKPA